MNNNENKSEVTDKELEDELEKVKNSLLELDSENNYSGETIEIPIELATLVRDIMEGYVKSTEEELSGRHLNTELDENSKLFLQSMHTCINAFNELLSK